MAGKSNDINFKGNNIMALNKITPTPSFDNGEGEGTSTPMSAKERLQAAADARAAQEKEQEQESQASKPAAQPATTALAPAAKTGGALQATKVRTMIDPLESLKDVFPVEFDTLPSIQLIQGNVVFKDTEAALGDEVGIELLSYQDQTVVSPGVDGSEAKEHVRYSDDGITTTKGESVAEHLQSLKEAGYEKANTSKRLVLVGSLFDPGVKGAKIAGMKGKLVQLNMPPSSVKTFKGYRAQEAFNIGKGMAEVEGVERVRITCVIKKNGDNSYTVGEFSRYGA